MAPIRAMASSFWAQMPGWAAPRTASPLEASLGARCSTLKISCQDHKVPVTVSVELDAFPAVQSTAHFPGDHTSQQVSHLAKAQYSGKKEGSGARTGCRPLLRAWWSGFGSAGPTPTDRFSCGESGLSSVWAPKRLALAETRPELAVRQQTLTELFNSLNTTPEGTVSASTTVPPEL